MVARALAAQGGGLAGTLAAARGLPTLLPVRFPESRQQPGASGMQRTPGRLKARRAEHSTGGLYTDAGGRFRAAKPCGLRRICPRPLSGRSLGCAPPPPLQGKRSGLTARVAAAACRPQRRQPDRELRFPTRRRRCAGLEPCAAARVRVTGGRRPLRCSYKPRQDRGGSAVNRSPLNREFNGGQRGRGYSTNTDLHEVCQSLHDVYILTA